MNKKVLTNKRKALGIGGLLAAVGVTLLILPAGYFDEGQAMCISVLLLDMECYGCGMTRAIQHLLHFDFEAAYEFNKLSFIVLPLAVGMTIWELQRLYKKPD
jgi:hypothetical protein